MSLGRFIWRNVVGYKSNITILQCFLMFFYFRFIRLLNASNCFIIMFSCNDFIHELTFLFKDAGDTNTWRAAIGLFWNVSMDSSLFYLTKCLRCILYSFLLLLITLFLLFTMHLYDANIILIAFLSLPVDSVNIKGNFFSKFANNAVQFLTYVCFLFIIILHINDIISAFWRYRNKSRSRPMLLEQFFL